MAERYYKKAKDGRAERTKVLNKGLERALTAAFGGDWLAFLDYLGEPIHPAEKISTSVEPTTLVVSGDEERRRKAAAPAKPREVGGPTGPEPTRYGDWEKGGIVSDF